MQGLVDCSQWEVDLVWVRSVKPQLSIDFALFLSASWHGYFCVYLSQSLMCYLQMWIEAEFKETESKRSVTEYYGVVLVQSIRSAVAVLIGFQSDWTL